MPNIITRIEGRRGCGYRKPGGLYFVTDGGGRTCFKLPIELTTCPCCGEGIKFSRGFTWITSQLFVTAPCNNDIPGRGEIDCIGCPLNVTDPSQRFGLMWVGAKYYTAGEFSVEAATRGISKRIAQIPHGFKVGETWVLLAHIEAIKRDAPVMVDGLQVGTAPHLFPGIFHAFKPSRIEYVVTGQETDEVLEAFEKRGFTLVHVVRDIDTQKELSFQDPAE